MEAWLAVLDEARWRDLCERGAPGFVERVHVPRLIHRPDIIADLLLDALQIATTRVNDADTDLPTMRAFREHCLDYQASERIMSGAFPGRATPVHGWLRERGGHDDICLAFNGVESWNVELAELLYTQFVVPLEQAGVPLTRGLDWYCFVASTGDTPFGIHADAEPSFIFHLGPAPKTAWTWSRSRLAGLPHGRPRTVRAEPLLPSADAVCLSAGDFLLIPAGMNHVFRNDGPSMFLGLTIYPEDPQETVMDALTRQVGGAAGDSVTGSVAALRDVLAGDRVELAVQRADRLRRSRAYGSPPRFPRRTSDQGPPYLVTRLPIVTADHVVFALGRELSVDLGGLAELLKPGALVGADQLRDAATTPELAAAVRALIHVGVLRSVGRPE